MLYCCRMNQATPTKEMYRRVVPDKREVEAHCLECGCRFIPINGATVCDPCSAPDYEPQR
jgi:hypothetical protein